MTVLQRAFTFLQEKEYFACVSYTIQPSLLLFSSKYLELADHLCFDYEQHFKTDCTKNLNGFPYHTANWNENWAVEILSLCNINRSELDLKK